MLFLQLAKDLCSIVAVKNFRSWVRHGGLILLTWLRFAESASLGSSRRFEKRPYKPPHLVQLQVPRVFADIGSPRGRTPLGRSGSIPGVGILSTE